MECFAHAGATAIGICRSCAKGVCRECARDLGFGLACSGRCAETTTEAEALSLRAKKAWAIGSGRKRKPNFLLIMLIVMGSLLAGFGAYNTFVRNNFDFVGLGMGSAFLLLALFLHFQVRDFFKDDRKSNVS